MSDKQQMPLAGAQRIADRVVELLAPSCERILIAGSIRRGKAMVGDVEIVAVSRTTSHINLLGEPYGTVSLLEAKLDPLRGGVLQDRPDKHGRPAWGPKHKRLVYDGFPIDLFITTPEQWGLIATIRTGPATFSHKLVTSRADGGYMPFGMRVKDGWLWRGGTQIATPEESDLFRAIGLPWVPLEDRT